MWLGNVDIPSAVVDAHRAANLVLFVRAGASMEPPSGVPNFTTHAARIADESAFAHTKNAQRPGAGSLPAFAMRRRTLLTRTR
jgi:hypothetical protein